MKQKMKMLTASICVLAIALVFNGCKKTTDIQTNELAANHERAVANLRDQVAKNPEMAAILFPINIKVPVHFEDANGNIMTSQTVGANFTYQCLPVDEMDRPPLALLQSISRLYDCSQGYKFTLTWRVSTSVNLVGSSGSSVTRGRIRIKDIFNTTLYSNLSITPATVTLIGDETSPTGNTNHYYYVSYTTAWLPFSYFTPNTTVFEHSLVVYTDCADAVSIVTAYASSNLGLDASTPCNRVDPAAPNNAQIGTGGVYITNGFIAGFRAMITSCPSPTVYPDRQQVQLKYVGPGSSDNFRDINPSGFSSTAPPGTIGNLYPYNPSTDAGTIGLFTFYYFSNQDVMPVMTTGPSLVPVHGSYKVRYRNRVTSSPGCFGDWSAEISVSL